MAIGTGVTITCVVGYGGYKLYEYAKSKMSSGAMGLLQPMMETMMKEMENEQFLSSMYEKTQAKCPAMASVVIKECGILNTINREMNLTTIVNDLKTCPKEDKAQQALLWELLKVGSFARVMVTFYSVTMLNTMVRMQTSIITRNSCSEDKAFKQNTLISETVREKFMAALLRHFIENESGLVRMIQDMKNVVTETLAGFQVSSTDATTGLYDAKRVSSMFKGIREAFEHHQPPFSILRQYFIPTDDLNQVSEVGSNSDHIVAAMINEMWDVLESPFFDSAVRESLDKGLDLLLSKLNESVFQCDSANPMSLHLSKVVPRLKALLLPLTDPDLTSSTPSDPSVYMFIFSPKAINTDLLCKAMFHNGQSDGGAGIEGMLKSALTGPS